MVLFRSVKLLLDRGAVIESVDSRGRTALKVAAAGDGSGNDNGNVLNTRTDVCTSRDNGT